MRRRRSIRGLLVALATLAVSPAAALADGGLDPSFDGDGRALGDVTILNEHVRDAAVDSQGRIVVVGTAESSGDPSRAFVARFNSSGTLDPSFSGDGVEFVGWTAGNPESASGVAFDGAGRILISGTSFVDPTRQFDLAVARFLTSGERDASFSGDGRELLDVIGDSNESELGNAVAVDSQGRALVAGTSGTLVVVSRFTTAGLPDASFGFEATTPAGFVGYEYSEAQSVQVDSLGRIVVGGTGLKSGGQADFGVIRLDGKGEFDGTFGSQGRAMLDFGSAPGERLEDLVIDGAGRYVVAGASGEVGHQFAAIGRLLPSGAPDAGFGNAGRTETDLPEPEYVFAKRIALDPAGRIVVAGGIGSGLSQDAWVARYTDSGILDSSFGTAGQVREDFFAANAAGEGLGVDPQGRYVLAGTASAPSSATIGLARFLVTYPQPTPPPASGPSPLRCRGKVATKVGSRKRETIRGTQKRDVIVALGGNDTVLALGGNDLVCAGAGRDAVKAGAGNDLVHGETGIDRLFGGKGKDRLLGEGGADRIFGGSGRDTLVGGPGKDVQRP